MACTLTGYVSFYGETLYGGASHDTVILDHSGLVNHLRTHGLRGLADGTFSSCQELITPFEKREIWPSKLSGQSDGSYETETHSKLYYNECIAHFRSRIEHMFNRRARVDGVLLRIGPKAHKCFTMHTAAH